MVSGVAALIRSRWPNMPAAEVVNRIIETAEDRGPAGRDAQYGFGMVDPTGALTAEVPAAATNPLDTSPPPGVARFGSAPAAGQAQSAPDNRTAGTVGTRVPGANAGVAVTAGESAQQDSGPGWWAAAGLFLLSAAAGLVVIRRFADVT
jgi:hypothetical protein